MSDDGGFEEVEEFSRAAANCSCNSTTLTRKASTTVFRRWHLEHDFYACCFIQLDYTNRHLQQATIVNGYL